MKYEAVVFDLLTALLDSWTLWNTVAGSEQTGLRWRNRYLELTYQAGTYRPYEDVITAAARDTLVPAQVADRLIERWSELKPWPECNDVLGQLAGRLPLGVVTNSSIELAQVAMTCLRVAIPIVITAQESGYYKPRPEPYKMALERLGLAAGQVLFVAGSAADVPGAAGVGMPVYWHNRKCLSALGTVANPVCVEDNLYPLLDYLES